MKFNLLILASALLLSSCGLSTTGSSTLSGDPSSTDTNSTPNPQRPISTVDLSLIQAGATVATGAVLQFAEKDPVKRAKLANQIYSSASALYTMTGPNAALASPDQFSKTLLSFGLSQTIAGYSSYTASLSAIYAAEYQKYIQGSITGQNLSAIINALAQGAQSATQTYVTVPVIPIGTSL